MVTKLDITRIQQFLKRNDAESFDLAAIVRLAELLTNSMLLLLEDHDRKTYDSLNKISQSISDTKKDLADFQASEMHDEHIPEAGRELDAVVEATEGATNRIMEAAETIMSADPSQEEYSDMVNNNIIEIFEACSFQDITGQRISKVVRTLNIIEEQIGAMIHGIDAEKEAQKAIIKNAKNTDEPQDILGGLLNGPAMEGEGVDQNDIDALFD